VDVPVYPSYPSILTTNIDASNIDTSLSVAGAAVICLGLSIVTAYLAGCTRAELEHKADAYNQAIAESNNRQILLNAVRASQRAPMSVLAMSRLQQTGRVPQPGHSISTRWGSRPTISIHRSALTVASARSR
jgi:hypothetical protein